MTHYLKFLILLSLTFSLRAQQENPTLAERAALTNDWIIDKGQQAPILKPLTWATSRAVSVGVFPACSVLDMAILTAKQAKEAPYVFLKKDPAHQENFKKNAAALRKATLGIVTAPIGIVSPDIVTHHFIPRNIATYQLSPYGKLYHTKAHVAYPKSMLDLQLIVIEAKRSGKSISTIGRFMSQGKQAISNKEWNVVVNTSELDHIEIDPVNKTARVGAGVSWGSLQNAANEKGLAVRVMQASNIFSIGGSISANCHGWDYKSGTLRNTILSLTLVDADANIHEITPQHELFDYVVGGYGGFGIIAEAVISLTDNVMMSESGIEVPPKDYVSYFNECVRQNDAISMHLYRLSLEPKKLFRTGVAVNYITINNEPVTAPLIDEPEAGTSKNRIALHSLRRLPLLRGVAWNKEKHNAIEEHIASRNELMRPPINVVFNNSKLDAEWLQEYFVPEENLHDFLSFLGKLLEKNNVALFNASVRFVKQDPETKLSYAPTGDRFAVVLFFNQKLSEKEINKTKGWVREVIDYLIAHDGSYYLPYQHFATVDQFKACYPNYDKITAYKQSLDPTNVFSNGLYEEYISLEEPQKSLFRTVFSRKGGQREKIKDFLDNVFMQLDDAKFFALVDNILQNHRLNDNEIYEELYKVIGSAKANTLSHLKQTLTSLSSLKNDLGDQTAELVGPKKIKGYVEIGYPGRMIRPLKKRLEMTGPFYVITDNEAFSDYVEAGFPRPYDQFIPLNNYAPIPTDKIPDSSVDLVCMYIGLHHAPDNVLNSFIASIKRILRPGGQFILMDHDAGSQEMKDLVDVVHSIFNVATHVTPGSNAIEVRNFQSLEHWITVLETHGLVHHKHDPLIRAGDSTLNTLIRFDKPGQDFSTLTETRPEMQTYLTGPEWQNVRAAQRYADFVEKEPAYNYPYFSEIAGFWKVYGNSWKAARNKESFSSVALSEYNMMNLFVGTTMTLELGTKGIVAAPFSLVDKVCNLNPQEKSATDMERLRSLKHYGKFIENTPFYQYPYFTDIRNYWTAYPKNKGLIAYSKGLLAGTAMTVEYTLKGLISAPMRLVYGSEAVKEDETIQMLIVDEENIVESLDSKIIVRNYSSDTCLKQIELPRYMQFTELLLKIATKSSAKCVEIAGHNKIQIDIAGQPESEIDGTRFLYRIPVPTDPNTIYSALEVDVDHLFNVINRLHAQDIRVLFVHDF